MNHYSFIIFEIVVVMVIWIPLCISKYKKWHHRKTYCTQKIIAQVTDIMEKKSARGSMMYKPIFSFVIDETTYTINSAYFSAIAPLSNGQNVELLINPNNIQEFIYVDDKYNYGKTIDIMCCISPIFFLIMIIIISLSN